MATHFRFAIIISYILLSCSGCSDSDPVAVISNTDLSFSKFGYSGGIADVNADGFEEIAVGAPDAEGKGALLIYSAAGELKYSIESPKKGYNFASAFTALPDVNGDGTNDFAVGALHANGMSPISGAVFVYNGSSPPTLLWTLKGEIPLDKFSYRIAGGDFNNDGLGDIAVSAVYASGKVYQAGRVYIYLGGAIEPLTADVILDGDHEDHGTGLALEMCDVNGDSIDDLLVGNWNSVRIYYGGAAAVANLSTSSDPDVTIKGSNPNSFSPYSGLSFGDTIESLGDVSGDGINDFAVANPRRSAPDTSDYKGAVYIYLGSPSYPTSFYENDPQYLQLKILGEDTHHWFGSSMAKTDGGGLLVGAKWAPGESGTVKVAGKVYHFDLQALLNAGISPVPAHEAALSTYSADTQSGEFSTSLDASGDIFLAGAPYADANGGRAFSFSLSSGLKTELGESF
ncbi:MAG: hypothetical protein WBG28_03160 [Desulfobulbales bacterium]